jgi:hypothetical protein
MMTRRTRSQTRELIFNFKALMRGVKAELTNRGIAHWRTHRQDHVDIYISRGDGRKPLEVRITLGTRERARLITFVRDSLDSVDRGVRVYVEVSFKDMRASLDRIVSRVLICLTRAMRTCSFGEDDLIGYRVYGSPKRAPVATIELRRRAKI